MILVFLDYETFGVKLPDQKPENAYMFTAAVWNKRQDPYGKSINFYTRYIKQDYALPFSDFSLKYTPNLVEILNGTVESKHPVVSPQECYDGLYDFLHQKGVINNEFVYWVGRNLSFDWNFMPPEVRTRIGWNPTKCMDPAMYFLTPEKTGHLPSMDTCLKYAGIDKLTEHTSEEDVKNEIELFKVGMTWCCEKMLAAADARKANGTSEKKVKSVEQSKVFTREYFANLITGGVSYTTANRFEELFTDEVLPSTWTAIGNQKQRSADIQNSENPTELIECKIDLRAHTTGNLALETTKHRSPSGIFHSAVKDISLYIQTVAGSGEAYMFKPREVAKQILNYKDVPAGIGTSVKLVPLEKADDLCFAKLDLINKKWIIPPKSEEFPFLTAKISAR